MSGTDRWARVRAVLEDALELPVAQRESFVANACGADVALRREVELLLAADGGGDDSRLGLPHARVLRGWLEEHMSRLLAGKRIGSFRLRRILACGGMGTVYEAEQEAPQRRVALKMMRIGLGSPAAARRFRWETEVLAHLRHPNIAQVYEAGVHVEEVDGQRLEVPYFAMELVEGARALPRYADEEGLDVATRLRLFVAVCHAVQEGHRHGLIHRDLKPGNLLVDGSGRVKVIDFGVARAGPQGFPAGGAGAWTLPGETIGTLRYMSPEQLTGAAAALDVRTDVYSLGVVLYELLSGRSPYPDADGPLAQVAGVLRRQTPVPLRERDARLRGDVESIVAKAMQHDREQRYGSAGELAADVGRFLDGLPVAAVSPSIAYRARKLVRRHRVAVGFAFLALVASVAGLVVATGAWLEAREQRVLADRHAAEASAVSDFLRDLLVLAHPYHRGPQTTLLDVVTTASAHVDASFGDRPGVAGELHHTIGLTWKALGHYRKAVAHLRRAVALEGSRFGGIARQIVARKELAFVLGEQGEHEAAAAQLARAVAMADRHLGPDDALTMGCRNLHATIVARLGRVDEAAAILERLIEASERVFGADSVETIAHVNNLGQVLAQAGRNEAAAPYTARSCDAMLARFGDRDPRTLVAMLNHGAVLAKIGRPRDAAALLERVEVRYAEQLGGTHPFTVKARRHLARTWGESGMHDRAVELLEAAWGELVQEGSTDRYADVLLDLVEWLVRSGDVERAMRRLEQMPEGAGEDQIERARGMRVGVGEGR